jgi:8-oxo-dGTP pyrophosphatase MutT (NUDIX family)
VFWVNVEAIVVRDGRLLVIERGAEEAFGAGWLAFPGGKVDPGEPEPDTIERTARRELLEEVGIDLAGPWRYVGSSRFDANGEPALNIAMCATGDAQEARIIDPGEVAALAWHTPADLRADSRTQPWTLATIARLEDLGFV